MKTALAAFLLAGCMAWSTAGKEPSMDRYNVVWTTPSADARGSMPLGNGDIGVNAWMDAQGDVEIRGIDFVGNGRCVPILLAITGVIKIRPE